MKNNNRYRILYKPNEDYPYRVEKKVLFFWISKTKHTSESYAYDQIVEYLRRHHTSSKTKVIREYSSEDYLADKLKGI